MSASWMLEIQNLHVAYGAVRVLEKISLNVAAGEIVCVLGANGAGKTSLLRAISNTMVQRSGRIAVAGQEVMNRSASQIVRLGVAHVPDGRGTFAHLSVEENLRLGAFARKGGFSQDALERTLGYFPRLRERYRQQAGTLSGGEQQMLAIGRALMLDPHLLLLDEPSFGLAPRIVGDIFDILRQINAAHQTSVVLVEQNAAMALNLAARAYLLETGRIVLSGSAVELRSDHAVRRAYLGS